MLKRILQKLKFAAIALGVTGVLVGAPAVSFAAPVDVLDKCDSQSKVCADRDDPKNTLPELLKSIINLLLMVIGIISVIMIIIGGFRYTTSGGDAGQTKSARDTIIYAVVGLVIAVMSFAIVNFVLARL